MRYFLIACFLLFLRADFIFAQEISQEQMVSNAQALENQGKFAESVKIYEILYKTSPKDVYFFKLLYLYENIGDNKSLRSMVLDRLQKNPSDLEAKRYLARTYYKENDKSKARDIIRSLVKDKLNDQNLVNYVAYEFINQSEFDEALSVYSDSRKKINNKSVYCLEMARIYELKMDYIEAIEEYIKGINYGNAVYVNIEQDAYKALDSGIKFEDVCKPFIKQLDEKPESVGVAKILSGLTMRAGYPVKAYTIIRDASIKAGEPLFLWNLAVRLKNDGLNGIALNAFEDYAGSFKKAPNRVDAMLEAASLRTLTGDSEGSKRIYSTVINEFAGTDKASIAALKLIDLSRKETGNEKYFELVNNLAENTGFREVSFNAYLELSDIYLLDGRLADAKTACDKAKLKAVSDLEKYSSGLKSSMIAFYNSDYALMNLEIDSCVNSIPEGSEVNDLLTIKILGMKCASQTDKDSFNSYSKALYEKARGDTLAALDYLVKAAEDSSAVMTYASKSLGDIYRYGGKYNDALKWYKTSADYASDKTLKIEALICAADVAEVNLNDGNQAKEMYLSAITSYPGNVYETELRNRLKRLVEK